MTDLIKARGYGIYQKVLLKALNFLMNTVLTSVITHYDEWEATVTLKMTVKNNKVVSKGATITVVEVKKNSGFGLLEEDTTTIDKEDLELLESELFETVIKTIDESGE